MECIGFDFSPVVQQRPGNSEIFRKLCAESDPPLYFGVSSTESILTKFAGTAMVGLQQPGESIDDCDRRRAEEIRSIVIRYARDLGATPDEIAIIQQMPVSRVEVPDRTTPIPERNQSVDLG